MVRMTGQRRCKWGKTENEREKRGPKEKEKKERRVNYLMLYDTSPMMSSGYFDLARYSYSETLAPWKIKNTPREWEPKKGDFGSLLLAPIPWKGGSYRRKMHFCKRVPKREQMQLLFQIPSGPDRNERLVGKITNTIHTTGLVISMSCLMVFALVKHLLIFDAGGGACFPPPDIMDMHGRKCRIDLRTKDVFDHWPAREARSVCGENCCWFSSNGLGITFIVSFVSRESSL